METYSATSLYPSFSQLFQEVLQLVLPGVTGDTPHDTPHRYPGTSLSPTSPVTSYLPAPHSTGPCQLHWSPILGNTTVLLTHSNNLNSKILKTPISSNIKFTC